MKLANASHSPPGVAVYHFVVFASIVVPHIMHSHEQPVAPGAVHDVSPVESHCTAPETAGVHLMNPVPPQEPVTVFQ